MAKSKRDKQSVPDLEDTSHYHQKRYATVPITDVDPHNPVEQS